MERNAPATVWSFFSGAMGLDLGFEMAGLPACLCVETDAKCCETIRRNRPNVCLIPFSVSGLHEEDLRNATGHFGEVDLFIGGPPCQSFSTGGNRVGLSDPRGNLIYEYLRLISEVRPRYFLLENVANLVTAAVKHRPIKDRPGKRWNLSSYNRSNGAGDDDDAAPLDNDEMSGTAVRKLIADVRSLGYVINFGVLDAAEYGAPQHRMRFILLASREGELLPLPTPTHGPHSKGCRPYVSLGEVIRDLEDDPGPHSSYGEFMSKFYSLVPPGGNWRDLPKEFQPEALGPSYHAGGGKTGFFRRLSWDTPAPTITGKSNRKATGLCHPHATRPLSVKECARIQGFPDGWQFAGSMNDAYLQVGNAVPVQLAYAVACSIRDHFLCPTVEMREKSDTQWLLQVATKKLRSAARNKRQRDGKSTLAMPHLFAEDMP